MRLALVIIIRNKNKQTSCTDENCTLCCLIGCKHTGWVARICTRYAQIIALLLHRNNKPPKIYRKVKGEYVPYRSHTHRRVSKSCGFPCDMLRIFCSRFLCVSIFVGFSCALSVLAACFRLLAWEYRIFFITCRGFSFEKV